MLYLNSPPVEPRERDYIYAGSFYVFAMWIGIGAMALGKWISDKMGSNVKGAVIASAVCLIVPGIMAVEGGMYDTTGDLCSKNAFHSVVASPQSNWYMLLSSGDGVNEIELSTTPCLN